MELISISCFILLAIMEPLTPSSALPKSRTPLSLPSLRSPSTVSCHKWLSISVMTDSSEPHIPAVFTSPADSPPGPYWVLSTNYDGHSLVYGCTDYGLFRVELSWILSRKPTLSKETLEKLQGILYSVGVSVENMVPTNQDETYCSPVNQWTS